MRLRYPWWRLLLLAVFLLGTFALMAWVVIANFAEARRDAEQGPAQQDARPDTSPRENTGPPDALRWPAPAIDGGPWRPRRR